MLIPKPELNAYLPAACQTSSVTMMVCLARPIAAKKPRPPSLTLDVTLAGGPLNKGLLYPDSICNCMKYL
jgi:hypothetical protein